MIQLTCSDLPPETLIYLATQQAIINNLPNYPDRVAEAKRLYENRTDNQHFDLIKKRLTDMCAGARRCHYCEDSCADEVEHIKPKNIYPEETFVWENYLYACGTCNSPKLNKFAILSNGVFMEIIREVQKKGAPPIEIHPPAPGTPVLINPRTENPLEFMGLDLQGTFFFWPKGEYGSLNRHRAEYTIRILHLNDRDYLIDARREAFDSYRARLSEYISEKNRGRTEIELDRRIRALKRMQHPTVWREMKMQNALIPELEALFAEAPEALNW